MIPLAASRSRQVVARLALLALGTLLGALLLEVSARWLLRPQGAGKEAREGRFYTRYDPLLGWSKVPSARVTYRRDEYTVEVAVNSHGLRDPERDYEPPPGTWRALALGDSFLEGYTVPLEQTVTQVLERALRQGGLPADVINGGTMAWSTDQEYLFFRSEGLRYRPQVVLLFLYYNDIFYNDSPRYFDRNKPLLVLQTGELRPRRFPVKPPAPGPAAADNDTRAAARAAEPAPSSPTRVQSVLLSWVRERLLVGAPAFYDRLANAGLVAEREQRVPRPELRVYSVKGQGPQLDAAWNKTAAIVAALNREATVAGARLLVVYVPSRMEIHDDAWALAQSTYRLRAGQWARQAVVRRLEQCARESGYPVLDLSSALKAADRGWRGRPYFAHDGHWTAIGHRAAAQAILAELRQRGFVPGPDSPGSRTP